MLKNNETASFHVLGRVRCYDADTDELIADESNAVNFENIVQAVAELLAGSATSSISHMAFGNGAISINGLGEVEYKSPNVSTTSGELYNETYDKFILNAPGDDPDNNIQIDHETGQTYSDIICTCTLEKNEPSGQNAEDTATSLSGGEPFVFNEIGLKNTSDLFYTHFISSPIEKSANRRYRVVYSLRITTG